MNKTVAKRFEYLRFHLFHIIQRKFVLIHFHSLLLVQSMMSNAIKVLSEKYVSIETLKLMHTFVDLRG